MTPFEQVVAAELMGMVRAGVPAHGVRLTVQEMVFARIERGPLGAREVSDTVEAVVRAACRLVLELDAPEEMVETVCRAALAAVRGHGGESARWLAHAMRQTEEVLDELARERAGEPAWYWLARRRAGW